MSRYKDDNADDDDDDDDVDIKDDGDNDDGTLMSFPPLPLTFDAALAMAT